MKYRITTQHLKSDSKQTITTTNIKEDAKKLYINSAKNDYFTLLEQCRCGEWERITFQIGQGDTEKELNYILNS